MSTPKATTSASSDLRKGRRPALTRWAGILMVIAWSETRAVLPESPKLGVNISEESVRSLDISVFPDGTGLPSGKGTAVEGKALFESHCSGCHGVKGSGGSADELVGRSPLQGASPDQTVGNYWPYATTLFDYIRRAMPYNAPRSLSNDQVYALTAYLLYLNEIVPETIELNATTLKDVRMPNREGFLPIWGSGGR